MTFEYGDIHLWVSPLLVLGVACAWGIASVIKTLIGRS